MTIKEIPRSPPTLTSNPFHLNLVVKTKQKSTESRKESFYINKSCQQATELPNWRQLSRKIKIYLGGKCIQPFHRVPFQWDSHQSNLVLEGRFKFTAICVLLAEVEVLIKTKKLKGNWKEAVNFPSSLFTKSNELTLGKLTTICQWRLCGITPEKAHWNTNRTP